MSLTNTLLFIFFMGLFYYLMSSLYNRQFEKFKSLQPNISHWFNTEWIQVSTLAHFFKIEKNTLSSFNGYLDGRKVNGYFSRNMYNSCTFTIVIKPNVIPKKINTRKFMLDYPEIASGFTFNNETIGG